MKGLKKSIDDFYNSLTEYQRKTLFNTLLYSPFELIEATLRQQNPELDKKQSKLYVRLLFKTLAKHECGRIFPSEL